VEEDRVVCIRFGHAHDSDCMVMDETLYNVSEMVQNFAVIYLGESPVSLVVMRSKLTI
jgi:DIM1 family U5 snRNP protein